MPSKRATTRTEPDDDDPNFVLRTQHDYPLDEIVSALQKAVRRGREREGVFIVREMVDSGYVKYLWRRVVLIASEECSNDVALCAHIGQLAKNAELATSGFTKLRNSIIETQAVIALCRAPKSREACDAMSAIFFMMKSGFRPQLHPSSVDKHTRRGKQQGKTVQDFRNEGRYVAGEQDATTDPLVRNDWEEVFWGARQPRLPRPGEEGGEPDIELPELVWDESKPNADPFVPEGQLNADGGVEKPLPAGRNEARR
jgi:hypothetical protein